MERRCRVSKNRDGTLCRVQVDATQKKENCNARYDVFKKGTDDVKVYTACFGRHLKNEHPGWERMLEEEDARAIKRNLLSSYAAVVGWTAVSSCLHH